MYISPDGAKSASKFSSLPGAFDSCKLPSNGVLSCGCCIGDWHISGLGDCPKGEGWFCEGCLNGVVWLGDGMCIGTCENDSCVGNCMGCCCCWMFKYVDCCWPGCWMLYDCAGCTEGFWLPWPDIWLTICPLRLIGPVLTPWPFGLCLGVTDVPSTVDIGVAFVTFTEDERFMLSDSIMGHGKESSIGAGTFCNFDKFVFSFSI